MSRISETTNVTITTIAVAPRIVINWNPTDDTGSVEFHTAREELINDEFHRLVPGEVIALPIEEILARSVSIPLPDGETFEFPPMLIGAYIKQLFDDIYTERANAVDMAPNPASDE